MSARRALMISAVIAFVGTLTSGPLALWVVASTHPQPAWHDAETFARAYHPIQMAPFLCGFLLVGGMLSIVSCLHCLAPRSVRPRSTVAVALAGAFAAMIFTNYAVQTTFVPTLVRDWSPSHAPLIAALTMTNPRSMGWALEMWGYAVLGVATWLCAPVFGLVAVGRWSRAADVMFRVNGPISIAGGFGTALWPGWVSGSVGIAAFAAWNLIVLAMTLAAALAMRRTLSPHERAPATANASAASLHGHLHHVASRTGV